jgi:hypothetical protein
MVMKRAAAALVLSASASFAAISSASAVMLGPPPADPRGLALHAIDTCRNAAIDFSITAPSYSVGRTICVYGDINRDMASAFQQLDMNYADVIVVSSPGGSVASALDMVEHMGIDRQTLVVDGLCASSCANYLFLAARWKIVPEESLVGWHGAPPDPRRWAPPDEMPAQAAAFALTTMWRSEDFFYRVGVSDRVARETPDGINAANLAPGAFWSHSRSSLEWRFGVGGILMAPEQTRTIPAYAAQ